MFLANMTEQREKLLIFDLHRDIQFCTSVFKPKELVTSGIRFGHFTLDERKTTLMVFSNKNTQKS